MVQSDGKISLDYCISISIFSKYFLWRKKTTLLFIRDVQQVHYLPEKWEPAPFRSVLKRRECWYFMCLRKASFRKER